MKLQGADTQNTTVDIRTLCLSSLPSLAQLACTRTGVPPGHKWVHDFQNSIQSCKGPAKEHDNFSRCVSFSR